MEETLKQRLKAVRELLGFTQRDIARAIDVGLRSWQDYESGNNVPGSGVLHGLCELGVNGHWLLTGIGAPIFSGVDDSSCTTIEFVNEDPKFGRVNEKDPPTVSVPFWPGVSDKCIAFKVQDDSMLNDGIVTNSIVIVSKDSDIESGSLALVDLWGAYTVKRFFKSSKGEVMLKPSNPAHVETRFNMEESIDIHAIGTVVAVIKKFTVEY